MTKLSPHQKFDLIEQHSRAILLATGFHRVHIIAAENDDEFREDLIATLRDRFGVRAVDPRTHDVVLKWVKPDHVTEEQLQPSFEEVAADTSMRITPAQLARALATWDEESKDKGWPERKDDEGWSQTARYVMGIINEHRLMDMMSATGDEAPRTSAQISDEGTSRSGAWDTISLAGGAAACGHTAAIKAEGTLASGSIMALEPFEPMASFIGDVMRESAKTATFVTVTVSIDGRTAEKIAAENAASAVASETAAS